MLVANTSKRPNYRSNSLRWAKTVILFAILTCPLRAQPGVLKRIQASCISWLLPTESSIVRAQEIEAISNLYQINRLESDKIMSGSRFLKHYLQSVSTWLRQNGINHEVRKKQIELLPGDDSELNRYVGRVRDLTSNVQVLFDPKKLSESNARGLFKHNPPTIFRSIKREIFVDLNSILELRPTSIAEHEFVHLEINLFESSGVPHPLSGGVRAPFKVFMKSLDNEKVGNYSRSLSFDELLAWEKDYEGCRVEVEKCAFVVQQIQQIAIWIAQVSIEVLDRVSRVEWESMDFVKERGTQYHYSNLDIIPKSVVEPSRSPELHLNVEMPFPEDLKNQPRKRDLYIRRHFQNLFLFSIRVLSAISEAEKPLPVGAFQRILKDVVNDSDAPLLAPEELLELSPVKQQLELRVEISNQ